MYNCLRIDSPNVLNANKYIHLINKRGTCEIPCIIQHKAVDYWYMWKIKLSKDNLFILNSFQYICPDKDYMLKTMLQLNFDRCEN